MDDKLLALSDLDAEEKGTQAEEEDEPKSKNKKPRRKKETDSE
jgi:hypothetical protein